MEIDNSAGELNVSACSVGYTINLESKMEKLCLNDKDEFPDDEVLSRYPGRIN